MGWHNEEHPEHEGYLVGLVKVDYRFRELESEDGNVERVEYVQMACSCGWRSPRLAAPYDTKFSPSIVLASEALDELGLLLWQEHVAATAARPGLKATENGNCLMPYEALAPIRKAIYERQVREAAEELGRVRRAG